jgi:hypothetical protein
VRPPALALVALLAALAPPAATGAKPRVAAGAKTPTAPVEVVGESLPAKVKKETLAVAVNAWKEASALYGAAGQMPDAPRQIVLDRSIAEYEAACDRLHCPDLKRNLAFTADSDGVSHVVLQPVLAGEAFKQLAPTFQTLRLVGHETAHLARDSLLPNHASHPGWFVDGNASYVEWKALQAVGRMRSPESTPTSSTAARRVRRLLESNKLPSIPDLVHDRTAALDFYARYDVRFELFRWLAEGPHAKGFQEFLADLRRLGGGEGFTEEAARSLKERLGVADLGACDGEFHAWLAGLKPEWDEVLRALDVAGEVWTQSAFDDANALAFRTEPAGPKSYVIEGSMTLIADRRAKPQANLLLGRVELEGGGNRFVSVALVPGDGVTLFDYDGARSGDDAWHRLADGAAKETAVGRSIPFRVECSQGGGKCAVSVSLAGRVVAKADVARLLDGPFGVGVQAGGSCQWRGVKKTALSR